MPPTSFYDRLIFHSDIFGDKAAAVDGDRRLDYMDLRRRVERSVYFMRSEGLDETSTVGISIKDEIEHLIAVLGLFAIGARQITLASHDQPKMRQVLAGRVRVSHVLSDGGEPDLDGRCLVWPPEDGGAAAMESPSCPHSGSGVLFLRTSGTTGEANLLPFSEQQIGLQAARHADYREEALLRLAGIEHNNSKRHRLYCLWNGGTNVFFDSRRPDLARFIEGKGVTCLDISRMHAEGLPKRLDAGRLADIKIRTGGSGVPIRTRRAIEQFVSARLYVRYATSETGAISMAMPGEHDGDDVSGRPLPGVVLRIKDPSGKDLAPGEIGAIAIRAPGMVEGYFDNPAQTAERFRDGWFYPGDVGYLRADGQLVIGGRADEMIIMNGLNIFPKEIESVLESHPDVVCAAALAVKSSIHGDIPVAVVELEASSTLTGSELVRWSHGALGLRTPRRIVAVGAMPRNSQGKISKRNLAALFARNPGART
jgi:acyl-coenzyme A synthetase/AMP-(fatty) acid ligase